MASESSDFPENPPTETDGEQRDPLAGVTIVQPSWCTQCAAPCVPLGRGQCPVCGGFVLRNRMSAAVDNGSESRIRELANRLVRDYGAPSDEIGRSQLEALAKTLARLERVKPGTTEHLRLIHAQQALVTALKETLTRQRRQQQQMERRY